MAAEKNTKPTLKRLLKDLRKSWKNFRKKITGEANIPKLYRANLKFKKRYPNYEIGIGSYGVPIVHDWSQDTTLTIGKYCSIARNVQIYLGGDHRTDWVTTYPFPLYLSSASSIKNCASTKGDVCIGNDVWLCNNCTILSGVTIGHGAVIGSNAVVSKDVEPYAIMAGNPAKLVRWRFDEKTREALLKHAWWDWHVKEIEKIAEKLCSTDLDEFIAYAEQRQHNTD